MVKALLADDAELVLNPYGRLENLQEARSEKKQGRIKRPDPTSTYEKRPLGGQCYLREKNMFGFKKINFITTYVFISEYTCSKFSFCLVIR